MGTKTMAGERVKWAMNVDRPYQLFSSVSEREVAWLWYPYIPYGKITVLQGDPGEGKSTFMIHLAAIVSRGYILPDGTESGEAKAVIYQCAEDSVEDTVKPRLISAGADCDRVAFIPEEEVPLTLDDERIEHAIQSTGARLVVLDPLQAFIGQDGDMQSATKMRAVLRRLASIADKNRCAVVLVGHMNKSAGGKSLYRGLGSIDIAAIARSVLMIERDPSEPSIRYMFPVKSSLAPEGAAIGFLFDEQLGFRWIGRCCTRLEETKCRSITTGKQERARQLIRLMLAAGDQPSVDMFSRLTQLGISEKTIKNAKKELGVETYRKAGAWYWKAIVD